MWRFLCQILSFCDDEVISTLKYEMRSKGARFLLGETIKHVEVSVGVLLAWSFSLSSRVATYLTCVTLRPQKAENSVTVHFNSGKIATADALLYTVGRQAATDGLNLEAVDLARNSRGLLTVNKSYQTNQPHMCVPLRWWDKSAVVIGKSEMVELTNHPNCSFSVKLRGWRLYRRTGARVDQHGTRPPRCVSHVGRARR